MRTMLTIEEDARLLRLEKALAEVVAMGGRRGHFVQYRHGKELITRAKTLQNAIDSLRQAHPYEELKMKKVD